MRTTLLALVCSCVLTIGASAQPVRAAITGSVRDSVSGEPLAGATIRLRGTVRGTTTGRDGTFRLQRIPAGVYTITASFVGYQTATRVVAVGTDVPAEPMDLRLVSAPIQADQMVVTASRHEQSRQDVPVSIAVVDASDIAARAVVTVDEALRTVSGVNMTLDQVNIRGSSGYSRGVGSRVLLLIDGLPFLTGDTGEISWEAIPIYQIDHIEIIKGAGSVLYGSSALGGVINIITKPIPDRTEIRLRLSSGLYQHPVYPEWDWWTGSRFNSNALVSVSSRIGNVGTLLSVTRSVDDSYLVNDAYHRWNFFGKTAYAFDPSADLIVMGNVNLRTHGNFFWWRSQHDATRPDDSQLNGNVNSTRGNISAAFRRIMSDRLFYTLKASYVGNFWQDDSAGRVNNTSASHLSEVEAQMTWTTPSLGTLTTGVSATYDAVHSNIFGSHPGIGAAVYAQLEYAASDAVKLTGGIRTDWQKVSVLPSAGHVDPKVGMTWSLDPVTTLRASFGTGFRYPSISELYTSVNTGVSQVRIVPNEHLQPERSESYEIGIVRRLGAGIQIDCAAFWSDYHDLIEAGVDPGRLVIEFNNVTRARVRGIEAVVNAEWFDGHVLLDAGYTYMDPEDLGTGRPLKFRPRHLLTATGTLALGAARLSVDGRFISRTEAIDENLVRLAPIVDGDARVPIRVVDGRASYDLIGLNLPVRLGFNVKNMFNYSYVEMIGNLAPGRTFFFSVDCLL